MLAAAVVLLAAGLAGPALRHFNAAPDPARQQERRVEAEQATLRKELIRDRDVVLATMRERLQRGDPQGAMSAATRFHALGDPEINALYEQAAQRVSFEQRLDEVRRVVEAKCTPLAARIAATQFMRTFARVDADTDLDALVFTRLADSEARPAITAVVAKPRGGAPQGDDPVSRTHATHRARLHDYDVVALRSDPLPERILCAWRATGAVDVGGQRRAVTLDFWLAPTPFGQSLDFEPLVYSVR